MWRLISRRSRRPCAGSRNACSSAVHSSNLYPVGTVRWRLGLEKKRSGMTLATLRMRCLRRVGCTSTALALAWCASAARSSYDGARWCCLDLYLLRSSRMTGATKLSPLLQESKKDIGETVRITLDASVPIAIRNAMRGMREGGTRRIVVPPNLG